MLSQTKWSATQQQRRRRGSGLPSTKPTHNKAWPAARPPRTKTLHADRSYLRRKQNKKSYVCGGKKEKRERDEGAGHTRCLRRPGVPTLKTPPRRKLFAFFFYTGGCPSNPSSTTIDAFSESETSAESRMPTGIANRRDRVWDDTRPPGDKNVCPTATREPPRCVVSREPPYPPRAGDSGNQIGTVCLEMITLLHERTPRARTKTHKKNGSP